MEHKIIITTSTFGKFDGSPIQLLKKRFNKIIMNPYERKLSEDEVSGLIIEHQPIGIIAGVEPLTKKVLEQAQNLQVISRAGIGMDEVDIQAAKQLNISVINTPDAPTIPVAELTVGMILSLLRRIHRSDQGIRSGTWLRPMGQLLQGKTVGLIGCGRIGQSVADILNAFGCKILGCDPVSCAHEIISFTILEELLRRSDIVSLHLPYSSEIHHMINEDSIAMMKQGAYLINPSRGGLVDEDALYAALNNGYIAGAAIDCFEDEPYTGPLRELDNTLLTGHIGSYAREGRILMEKQAVENLISKLEEKGVL